MYINVPNNARCPNCGHCPACGRSNWPQPFYTPYISPSYPGWPSSGSTGIGHAGNAVGSQTGQNQ